MISNKDFQFISLIWNTICRMLKIKTKLFIAFHFETNEQSEIFNQKMKRYLRVYVNHQQNDWADWLSMIEYVSNASILTIIQMFLFLANYEFKSRMNFDQMKFDENTIKKRVNRFRKREIVFTMKKIWIFAKEHMKKSQRHQTTYVNMHKIAVSNYQIDEQIWFSIRNIRIDKSSRKLDHKMLESFKILKKKIQFILAWIIDRNEHSLNISYLIIEKEFRRFLSKQIISFSSSMMIDNDQKFEIENIVDFRLMSRTFNKQLQYKIKWVEHFSDRKWYFVENFDHAKEIVVDYHHRYSHKSKQQLIIVSLIINQVMKINWIKQSMKNAQNLIQKTLNRMKKRKKMIKSSTFSVDRNFINIKTASQDCFVTKATSVERILSNQKKKKDSVTISCHSLSQMISIKKN